MVHITCIPYQGATTYVCYDPVLGALKHVNVLNPQPHQQLAATNDMVSYQAPANLSASQRPQATSACHHIVPTLACTCS